MKEKYYTKSDLTRGIDGLPVFSKITLKNARQQKKIKYTKVGRDCVYRRDWVLEYLKNNEQGIENECK
ncbi:hypothetical protein [Halarcobacter anaerophilus]|uniref:DNA-binding protein n=1 Tax=Halarcobacter anaerophilus TaxID=877500 RepID=A0A4V1LPZ1_9BACT|nr:hypothetical protein [Halarcobacter anaerophilus]QDF29916.1 hypothetical protein AANAER_2460 [Halarcobacter anaerophilus]RXJ62878.1 hypothetical protein CRV06_08570 [Halarcobacter anaerophilus]